MTLPALPMNYRLISILFYLSLLFIGVVGSTALWHARAATQRYQSVVQQTSDLQKKIEQTKAFRSELEKNIREASDLENWVLGSMPLQPLVVQIIRSMNDAETSIVDLGIERDPEMRSQLRLSLALKSESDKQIKRMLAAINDLNYREFSPAQTIVQGKIQYRASLRWQKPEGATLSPQERDEMIVSP